MKRNRAGVNKSFSEDYYNEQEPVSEGEVSNIEYRIYNVSNSHYSLYGKFESICVCMIECGELPPTPTSRSVNFGPTEDNWIGFSTNGVTDYNYDSNWSMLNKDSRQEPDEYNYIESDDIKMWTPIILEESLTDWIKKTHNAVKEINMRCSH